ncbi:SPL family radical SAM protein [Spirochaeta cellobiosiphila]|uniref:SPL family radical SAM protein n=1 Tax=Spirochaeta cellobiosiphila TaxID=504483 RepID=UPI00041E173E|nr:radical SAM protein [Spirochaeta cellobiosiphila]
MNSLRYTKWSSLVNTIPYKYSTTVDLEYLDNLAINLHLTEQDLRNLLVVARDLHQWNEVPLSQVPLKEPDTGIIGKARKSFILKQIYKHYNQLREKGQKYLHFIPERDFKAEQVHVITEDTTNRKLLGNCPVASTKTRCCNLHTLDVVQRCGFDCTYCSIQSFYTNGEVIFDSKLGERLKKLNLEPEKKYHIGTGQSSDSLMWGNKNGILDDLLEFAEQHENVILEMKTKSDRMAHLLTRPVQKNVLLTWSLNPQSIIDGEEHFTASLKDRIEAARKAADHGYKVGFHFHPMIPIEDWKEEYGQVMEQLQHLFSPEEVVTISFGTLTFIKPVLKMIRSRNITTKILQMPLEEAAGKYSYSLDVKEELFSFAFNQFSRWHSQVFFYLCMEDPDLWQKCLKRAYADNDAFEKDMIDSYFTKMYRKK